LCEFARKKLHVSQLRNRNFLKQFVAGCEL